MDVKDMVENYLLSLGLRIKSDYKFIPKRDYDYNAKAENETVELGKYKVEISRANRNSREFTNILYNARDNFADTVVIDGDVGESCKKLVEESIIYYTDFLKYVTDNFEITPELADKIIILCNGGIDTVGREIQNALADYGIKSTNAQLKGQAAAAEAMADAREATKASRGTYVTLDKREGFFGDTYYGNVITGGYTQARKDAMMAGARQAAAIIESVRVDSANKEALEGIKKIRKKIINDFNTALTDLLCTKLTGKFNIELIEKDGNNIGENPIIFKHYLSVIDELEEKDFENFKKIVDFYWYSNAVNRDLTARVEDNMYAYYSKEHKFDYDKLDYKLLAFLKQDEFAVSTVLGNMIVNNLNNRKKDIINDKNKELAGLVEELNEKVKVCKYLKEEDKTRITNAFDEFKTYEKKERKIDKSNKILCILLTLFTIVSFAVSILNAVVFGVYKEGLGIKTFLIMIPVGIVLGVVCSLDKGKLRNILFTIMVTAFVAFSGWFGVKNALELVSRNGKFLVTFELNNRIYKAEYVKAGETITLEDVYKEGCTFYGWVDDNDKYIYNKKAVINNERKFEAMNYYTENNTFCTITLKFDNGKKDLKYEMPRNHIVNLPEEPEREGYMFLGWYNPKTKQYISSNDYVKGDMTFQAKWQKIK